MRGSSPRMTSRAAFARDDGPVSISHARRRRYHYPMTSQPIRHPLRILGIDPGLRRTGWGVIEIDGNRLIFLGCGSVEAAEALPLARRLLAIHVGLVVELRELKPAVVAVEHNLVHQDRDAILLLGQDRCVER